MKPKNEKKKETIELLEIMIQQSDKGPSGFWAEDYEGCGNPEIFPEFNDGLKQGKIVRKEHYLCPWNTAVLFGNGHGNINTGCYHSCSINEAKYLSPTMLKDVLVRFKTGIINGRYNDTSCLSPLLTAKEISYIKSQKAQKKQNRDEKEKTKRKERVLKANELIKKYPQYEGLFATHYGENVVALTYDGSIDFNPLGCKNIVGAEHLTYDEYIDVQIRSFGKARPWFATCYYNIPLSFKGTIKKKNKERICFERIEVKGMYSDGRCFEGKEEHVWMSINQFEKHEIGECVSFYAEVYRYVKTGDGKLIDYALRNPDDIQRVDKYNLPTDSDLDNQLIDELICETCYFEEFCNKVNCIIEKD